jgi:nucleosome binding factor SPN SPT16 subunit
MDILFSETNKNLAWEVVLNQIKEDIDGFVQDGGWAFLQDDEEQTNVKDLILE